MSTRTISSTLATVKFWTGQKLLHSRFHPLYLTVTGNHPKAQTYAAWLVAEAENLKGVPANQPFPEGYTFVVGPENTLAPTAGYWFARTARLTNADLIYADENVLDPASGRRSDPVFKPDWSPVLHAHCDYIGDGYLIRTEHLLNPSDWSGLTIRHIPRVLVHRKAPRPLPSKVPLEDPIVNPTVSVIICSRNPAMLGDCLEALRSRTNYRPYELVILSHRVDMSSLCERFGACAK